MTNDEYRWRVAAGLIKEDKPPVIENKFVALMELIDMNCRYTLPRKNNRSITKVRYDRKLKMRVDQIPDELKKELNMKD